MTVLEAFPKLIGFLQENDAGEEVMEAFNTIRNDYTKSIGIAMKMRECWLPFDMKESPAVPDSREKHTLL